MFEKLAKFRPFQFRQHVPDARPNTPANDNRLHASHHTAHAERPRLVCRWSLIEGTDRLACRWEIEGSNEPKRMARKDGPFHKIFFQLSYQPGLSGPPRLTNDLQLTGQPIAASTDSISVLHAGHLRMPSTGGAGVRSCSCETLAITLDDDFGSRRFPSNVG